MGKRKVSCLPCRLKKVKCTGQVPCERCQKKRTIDSCILAPHGAVGRPPKNGVVKRVNATITFDQTCREFIFEHCLKTSLTTSHLLRTPVAPIDYFFTTNCNRVTRFITQFCRQYKLNVDRSKRKMQIAQTNSFQDLIHLFSFLTSGLVDLFTQKVSKVKTAYRTEPKFVAIGLALDDSKSFFDTIQPITVDPLKSLPTEQGLELIEYFFCLNPQSIIINKTMLIESFWADTINPLLLSVIYGTAIYTSSLLKNEPLKRWGAANTSERNLFLNYAHTLLQQLQSADASLAGVTLSHYQAVVLLSIFEAIFGSPKKGASLVALSHMMATQLGIFNEGSTLSKIEREMLVCTFWSAYHGTIRGCIELDQIPRDVLAFHSVSLPPVNIYSSVSLRLDMMSGHTRLLKIDNYLVETFYVQSVIAQLTCRFLQILPYFKGYDEYKTQSFKPILTLTETAQPDQLIPIEFNYPCKDIRLGLQEILNSFKQFMDRTRETWSQLQEFNFDLIYLAYSLSLVFLKDEYTSDSAFRSRNEGLGQEEPRVIDYQRQLEEGLVICRLMVEKSLDFLEKTNNYCDDPAFVPKGLLMCCLDIASQLFVYSIKTDKMDKTSRYQLNHILSILWRNDVWNDWPPVRTATRTIETFLKSKIHHQDPFPFASSTILETLFFDGIC